MFAALTMSLMLSGVPPEGSVYTYYGLRKLELDPNMSDEEKLREWEGFVERSADQVAYAKKAIIRWKKVARLRVLDNVKRADANLSLSPRTKIERWTRLLKLYPRSDESRLARKRISHWRAAETRRLVDAADEIERARAPKVERVKAWRGVLDWVERGPEAVAARRRIQALRMQLFSEAESLDKIARIDTATKISVWREVLEAMPTKTQRKIAERRIGELERRRSAAAP